MPNETHSAFYMRSDHRKLNPCTPLEVPAVRFVARSDGRGICGCLRVLGRQVRLGPETSTVLLVGAPPCTDAARELSLASRLSGDDLDQDRAPQMRQPQQVQFASHVFASG